MKNALIIFVRNPELGKVKTRLAATMGDVAALEAYKDMLQYTRNVAKAIPCARLLFYAGHIPETDEWDPADFYKHLQGPGDLGDRMAAAFQAAFQAGHERVAIIGSDCLALQPHHVAAAFDALESQDFVLGPAADGGYYLLGMQAFFTQVFQNKAWSTDTVLRDTLADIAMLGKKAHLLETLSDIDTEADYRQALLKTRPPTPETGAGGGFFPV